jgi:zinc D-Ala-D-Ala carboxypeptidase
MCMASAAVGCEDSEDGRSSGTVASPDGTVGGKADGLGALQWPVLRQGDLDRSVVTAQYLLRAHSLSVPLTGAFGPETTDAVEAFQDQNDLVPDGVVGPLTWEALVQTVQEGDVGDAVKAVQDQLATRYDFEIAISGQFDAATAEAVAEFQDDQCLEPSAVVGMQTWNALVEGSHQCGGSGAARLLQLHRSGKITLWNGDWGRNDGADALSNVQDAAAGRPAKRSCSGGGLPCGTVFLQSRLLDAMVVLADQHDISYFVTAIAGGRHSVGSAHYAGLAFDVDEVDGVRINGDSAQAQKLMSACHQLGAVQVFGPSNDPWGHFDHVHCSF